MSATPEDQRNAANMFASLSSYVITASLAIIAAEVALAAFVLDKREHLIWFGTLLVVGLLLNVLSVAYGGRGVSAIAESGFKGIWTLKPTGDYFNVQAILCLAGMFCFLGSVFCGDNKSDVPKENPEVQRLQTSVDQLASENKELESRYSDIQTELKRIQAELEATGASHSKVRSP